MLSKIQRFVQTGLVLTPLLCLGTLALASKPEAALDMNGVVLNSVSINGVTLNGASLNGVTLNGVSINGANLNGVGLNGTSFNSACLVDRCGSGAVLTQQLQLEGSQLVLHR